MVTRQSRTAFIALSTSGLLVWGTRPSGSIFRQSRLGRGNKNTTSTLVAAAMGLGGNSG